MANGRLRQPRLHVTCDVSEEPDALEGRSTVCSFSRWPSQPVQSTTGRAMSGHRRQLMAVRRFEVRGVGLGFRVYGFMSELSV